MMLGSLVASAVLIVAGFFYAYYTVIPISVGFLTSAGFIPEQVGLLLNYDRNIFVVFQFLLMFLLLFQSPIVLVLLMMSGVVTRRALLGASRYVIVGIFVVSAAVTPPDVISQVSLAVPLVVMFFLSILIGRIFGFGADR